MEEKILEVLKNTFGLEEIDMTISQQTCEAWDSMGQLNLVVDLEETFDICLEPDEIGQMKNFDDIVRILKTKGLE